MKHKFRMMGRHLGLCLFCLTLLLILTACTLWQGGSGTEGTPTAAESESAALSETETGTPDSATETESAAESASGSDTQPPEDCAHTFGDWTVTAEPTCTADGTRTHTCTLCGVTETDSIPATGHTEVEDPALAPTCTENGKTAGSHCSVCGEIIRAQSTVYTFGHTAVTDAAVAPTCSEEGLTVGTHCSVCGEILTARQPVAKAAHTPVYDNPVEPTCTETGLSDGMHCSVCGEIIKAQEVLPLRAHTAFTEAGVPASCVEAGTSDAERCAVCGIMLTEHQPIPAKGHTPGPQSCTENQVCTECGEVLSDPLGHEPTEQAAIEPTCTEKGYTAGTVCARCGEVLSGCEPLPALGHRFAEDATCTESQTCLVCGELIESAGNHIEVIDPGMAPTCTEDGLSDGVRCAICGQIIVAQEVLPALGHDPVTDAEVEPTCQTTGLSEGSHCARCGLVFTPQEELPTVDHVRKRVLSKKPTCTESGNTVGYICQYCNTVLSGCEVVPPLGHAPVVLDTQPATCVSNGCAGRIACETCREILSVGDIIPALGHSMADVGRTEPTCTENGFEAGRICTACGYEEVIRLIIPATGHTPVTDESREPTDTEYGLSSGSHCAVCGEVLEKQRILPMTGTELHPGDAAAYRGIVISKVFGTGKNNTDASASHGFIELYNSSDCDIPLSGLSLYLRKDADDEFKSFAFSQYAVIPAGGYYLVRANSPEGYDPAAAVITVEYFDAEWNIYIDNKECSLVLAPSGWTLFPGEDVTELADAVSVYAASAVSSSDSVWFTDKMSKKKLLVRTAPKDGSGYYSVNLQKANTAKLEAVSPRTSDGRVNPVRSVLAEVYFSHPAGMYTEQFDLILTAAEGYTVKYTLDGTDPRTSSTAKEYTEPLTLEDSSAMAWGEATKAFQYSGRPRDEVMPGGYVVKAFATDGTTETPVYTNTYFVTAAIADLHVQVVSISMSADEVMDFYRYYGNLTVDDKRPRGTGVMEIFDKNGSRVGCSVVELAVNGKTSVSMAQKSMRIYYKDSNNTEGGMESDLDYDLFDGRALDANGNIITDFSRILLRNSGQDAMKSGIRDAFMQRMSAGLTVDTMASGTVVVFINGELWGVYNARERYCPEYFESHYGVDKDNVAILENDYSKNITDPSAPFVLADGTPGDEDNFNWLYQFITTEDMTDDAYLAVVEAHMDLDSLLDLFAARIFFNAKDWPENNNRVWRNTNPDDPSGMDTRWRFVLVDMDWGMSYLQTSTEDSAFFHVATNSNSVVSNIFRALMTNESFRERALVRFYRVFTEVYDTDVMKAELQAMYDERKPLMELNAMRWPASKPNYFTVDIWESEMQVLFRFAESRQEKCLAQFYQFYQLNDTLMQEMIARVEGTNE